MKRRRLPLLFCVALALMAAEIRAAEVSGRVLIVNGETITVAPTGTSVPNVGDKAEIFFQIEGVQGDVSVGTGNVIKVEGDVIQVRIEKATGEVAKDQLVRITSEHPQKRQASAPATAATPPSVATTPPPFTEPTSTGPPRRGKLVVEDNFDSSKDPLQMEGNKNVNGERAITTNAGSNRGRTYKNLPRDFYAQCYVRAAQSDPNCVADLLFHTLEKDGVTVTYDAVKFVPGALGFISGRDNQPGPMQSIPLPSGAYPDATRSISAGLEVIGDDVRVFIDDKCVANFRIDRPSEGRGFMLVAQSAGGSPCTYYFDNLKIYSASASSETSGEKETKRTPSKTSGQKKAKLSPRSR
jgi:hypothetical protein